MMVCTELVEKKRLYNQMYRVREIRQLQEEIDNIAQLLSSPSGAKLSDMPKSQNPFDKVGNLISRKIEKEKKLEKLINKAKNEKIVLENVIEKIALLPESPKGPLNSVLQDILRYRYIDDYPWKDIVNLIFADKDEFLDADSNLRKVHKWNGQALVKFIKCQS